MIYQMIQNGDQDMISYEQKEQVIREKLKEYDIFDLLEEAALQGADYGTGYDKETAEGVIIANPLSFPIRVMERLDDRLGDD